MRPLIGIVRSEEAVTSVEYAVMLAMILLAAIGAIGSFGAETGGLWGGIEEDLEEYGVIK